MDDREEDEVDVDDDVELEVVGVDDEEEDEVDVDHDVELEGLGVGVDDGEVGDKADVDDDAELEGKGVDVDDGEGDKVDVDGDVELEGVGVDIEVGVGEGIALLDDGGHGLAKHGSVKPFSALHTTTPSLFCTFSKYRSLFHAFTLAFRHVAKHLMKTAPIFCPLLSKNTMSGS